jgi:malonyl-CoA decarboxylase
MRNTWLERVLDSIADRGRELLNLGGGTAADQETPRLCHALLGGRGEASGIALSREILQRYGAMDEEAQIAFFECLHRDFAPDPEAIREAADAYLDTHAVQDFLTLAAVVEPPRQELLRRLNMAPHATEELVAMRADLLGLLADRPMLRDVDADFRHLLSSWFNRGFLRLERIDWHTPADILEKLIRYEAVHAIQGWDDLRRRLAEDRRCFAFFHPAMPDEPLIFLEVALVQGMADHAQPLIDPEGPVLPPGQADTAMFYSINATQKGLRGVSFGNFLIKQVLTELRAELPWLTQFATLSPMPRFARSLEAGLRGERKELTPAILNELLSPWHDELMAASGLSYPGEALLALIRLSGTEVNRQLLADPLRQLALYYLSLPRMVGELFDPVATFHIRNGARLERINPFADTSQERMRASYGTMVNYLYEPDEVEANHERFTATGEITLSKALARERRKLEPLLDASSPRP